MKKTPIVIALLGSFALCHSFNASALQTNTFNQNEFHSDTTGNFPATVLFAQNSITPSQNGVEDDIQPHLVAERRTMIMFKPHDKLNNDAKLHFLIFC